MSVPKTYSTGKFIWQSVLVFACFMLVDYLYYGLIAPTNPYSQDLVNKIIWTLVLSIIYTLIFYQFNANWWNQAKHGIIPAGKALLRGFGFGILMGALFIAVIALSCYVVMYSFIHLLDGFRGIPESGTDDALIIIKTSLTGAALAYTGKEEADGDRHMD